MCLRLSAYIRKTLFLLTGFPRLSDPIRNFLYHEIIRLIAADTRPKSILDIGSRNSLLPAFLSWRGYKVTALERESGYPEIQKNIARKWNTAFDILRLDLAKNQPGPCFDIVLDVLALQHAGDSDSECYRRIPGLLVENGLFISVVEFNAKGTRIVTGRADGDMTVYGPEELKKRIIIPLLEKGMSMTLQKFAAFRNGNSNRMAWRESGEGAKFCLMVMRRER
jgi:SAM-dependent methyltransferase